MLHDLGCEPPDACTARTRAFLPSCASNVGLWGVQQTVWQKWPTLLVPVAANGSTGVKSCCTFLGGACLGGGGTQLAARGSNNCFGILGLCGSDGFLQDGSSNSRPRRRASARSCASLGGAGFVRTTGRRWQQEQAGAEVGRMEGGSGGTRTRNLVEMVRSEGGKWGGATVSPSLQGRFVLVVVRSCWSGWGATKLLRRWAGQLHGRSSTAIEGEIATVAGPAVGMAGVACVSPSSSTRRGTTCTCLATGPLPRPPQQSQAATPLHAHAAAIAPTQRPCGQRQTTKPHKVAAARATTNSSNRRESLLLEIAVEGGTSSGAGTTAGLGAALQPPRRSWKSGGSCPTSSKSRAATSASRKSATTSESPEVPGSKTSTTTVNKRPVLVVPSAPSFVSAPATNNAARAAVAVVVDKSGVAALPPCGH